MRLAPAVFVWGDVLRFSEIGRTRVDCGVQVVSLNDDPMRHAIVRVTTVTVRVCRIRTGERIDPCPRTQAWPGIKTGGIRIGAPRAQIGAGSATAGVAAKTACVVFQRQECVFARRLTNLFEAVVVIITATHTIKVLGNNGMVRLRQGKPVQRLRAVITGSRRHSQTDLGSRAAELRHVGHIPDNDVGTWNGARQRLVKSRHDHRFGFAVDDVSNFYRLHRRADGDFSDMRTGIERAAQSIGKLL